LNNNEKRTKCYLGNNDPRKIYTKQIRRDLKPGEKKGKEGKKKKKRKEKNMSKYNQAGE